MQVKTAVDVQKLVRDINREHHLGMRVIRFTDKCDPDKPFVLHKGWFNERPWVFIPRHRDNSEIPPEIDRRPDILLEKVDDISGQWVGHPEPEFLPDEEEQQESQWNIDDIGPKIIAGLMAVVLVVIVAAVAAAILFVLIPVVLGLAMAAAGLLVGFDPSLVCAVRTEEGYAFIEVGRWGTE